MAKDKSEPKWDDIVEMSDAIEQHAAVSRVLIGVLPAGGQGEQAVVKALEAREAELVKGLRELIGE